MKVSCRVRGDWFQVPCADGMINNIYLPGPKNILEFTKYNLEIYYHLFQNLHYGRVSPKLYPSLPPIINVHTVG